MVEQVRLLRRARHTGKQITIETGLSPATVGRILKRLGLNRIECHRAGGPGAALRARKAR